VVGATTTSSLHSRREREHEETPLIIVRPCPDRFEGRAGAYAPSPSRPNLVLDGFTVIEISAIEFRFTDGVPVQVLFTCPICGYLPGWRALAGNAMSIRQLRLPQQPFVVRASRRNPNSREYGRRWTHRPFQPVSSP
jgi:hypothetical protein